METLQNASGLSDLYGAIDVGHLSLLTIFDVSSAFDSLDHNTFDSFNAFLLLLG